MADTNYRINLSNETVRSCAENDVFDSLVAADQVSHEASPENACTHFGSHLAQASYGRWTCLQRI